VIDVGVTPGPDAVLPAVPEQSAASAFGLKSNPAEVGEAREAAGVALAPAVLTPPVAAAAPVFVVAAVPAL
jgi:hypothetical protein